MASLLKRLVGAFGNCEIVFFEAVNQHTTIQAHGAAKNHRHRCMSHLSDSPSSRVCAVEVTACVRIARFDWPNASD